jgi:hypothetical protein
MEVMLGDRRSDRRYEMQLNVRYRLLRGSRVLCEGTGATTSVSRGGLTFTAGRFLPSGLSIQLWVEWPIPQRGIERVELRIAGRTLRCDGDEVAVRANWHEFIRMETGAQESFVRNEPLMVA